MEINKDNIDLDTLFALSEYLKDIDTKEKIWLVYNILFNITDLQDSDYKIVKKIRKELGTIYKKEEYLVFKINGVEKVAYTLKDTFKGEKQATLEQLAWENNCNITDITTNIELR